MTSQAAAATLTYTLDYARRQGKTWIARVDGRDAQYGYARTFVDGVFAATGSDNMGTYTYQLTEGLYEESETGTRLLRMVYLKDGSLQIATIDAARTDAILALMAGGHAFETARLATRKTA